MSTKKSSKKAKKSRESKSPHWETFRAGFRSLLAMKGMTQAELARRLGVRPQAIAAWLRPPESGEDEERTPNVETLLQIADVLGVSLDRLMGRRMPEDKVLWDLQQQLERVAGAIRAKLAEPGGKQG